MNLEKATDSMMNMAAEEKSPEKKELFEKAAASMTTLLSLEGEIKDHIDNMICKDKDHQKWYRLGQEQILNIVRIAISEVDA